MLKQIIEDCFSDIKENADANEGKKMFSNIWAVLAGKRARFTNGEIFFTWRALSAQLATLYNEWYKQRFTTDAFLRARSPDTTMGECSDFDSVMVRFYNHPDCTGIFAVKMGPPPTSKDTVGVFQEIDVLTGEQFYYQQEFKNGRRVGAAKRITDKEYETSCYSMR